VAEHVRFKGGFELSSLKLCNCAPHGARAFKNRTDAGSQKRFISLGTALPGQHKVHTLIGHQLS